MGNTYKAEPNKQKGDAATYAETMSEINIEPLFPMRALAILSLYFFMKSTSFPSENSVSIPCKASEATRTESATCGLL